MKVVLYARVSRDLGQNPESQLGALRSWCASRNWTVVAETSDRVTGDPARRKGDPPGLREALRLLQARKAQVLVVFAADRLVRSPIGLLQLLARVEAVGGKVASLQDGSDLDTTTEIGELMAFLRGWYARMELRLIRERTKAGQERARAQGKRIGAPTKPLNLEEVERRKRAGEGWRKIAKSMGCSHTHVKRTLERGRCNATLAGGPCRLELGHSGRHYSGIEQ